MTIAERVLLGGVEWDRDEVIELAVDDAVLELSAPRPGSDQGWGIGMP